MHRRWWQAAALALAIALVLASVSFNRGRTLIVSDMSGTPLVGAYVIYHHEGTTYALVDAVSYQASELAVLQSNSRGGVRIPWAVHVHLPVIRAHPAVSIDLVYAPSLHNALASVSRYGVVSRAGEFEVVPSSGAEDAGGRAERRRAGEATLGGDGRKRPGAAPALG